MKILILLLIFINIITANHAEARNILELKESFMHALACSEEKSTQLVLCVNKKLSKKIEENMRIGIINWIASDPIIDHIRTCDQNEVKYAGTLNGDGSHIVCFNTLSGIVPATGYVFFDELKLITDLKY